MRFFIVLLFLSIFSYSNDFSLIPSRVTSVSVQKNSELEVLMIAFDSNLLTDLRPTLTDSTIEFQINNGTEYSPLFQTANSTIAKGIAWSEGNLVVFLRKEERPAVILSKSRALLAKYVQTGKLENWQALPTGIKSSMHFLPSYEPLVTNFTDFAEKMKTKRPSGYQSQDLTMMQTILVRRSDASYIVTEDIASLFPSPAEGKPLDALEFGDRVKLVSRHKSFYKVRFLNKEGYVYQRDVQHEDELTKEQKARLHRMRKEAPGGVDHIAAKFGWKDDARTVYSDYGFRDPFIRVKGIENDSLNIDNMTLVGILYEKESPIAVFSNNKNKGESYTLSEGDPIKNGRILKISPDSVVFHLEEYGVGRRYKITLPDKWGANK